MPLPHSICVGVSSTTGSISNALPSIIQPSSTIQRSGTIIISASNTQVFSSENDSMLRLFCMIKMDFSLFIHLSTTQGQ